MNQLNLMLVLGINLAGLTGVAHAEGNRSFYVDELNSTFKIIEQNYAPLEWKATAIGLNWNAQKAALTNRVMRAKSTTEFYSIMADLFNGFNDAHTGIEIPSTFTRSIPLQFMSVENKFVVTAFDAEEMERQSCAVSVGDQLTGIDGMTPAQYQASNTVFNKGGNALTNSALFGLQVNSQKESAGARITSDRVKYSFVRDGAMIQCNLQYKVSGTSIVSRDITDKSLPPDALLPLPLAGLPIEEQVKLEKMSKVLNQMNKLFNAQVGFETGDLPIKKAAPPKMSGYPVKIGAESFTFKTPADFVEIKPNLSGPLQGLTFNWKAGYFTHNDKKIGLLRIPSYEPGTQAGWVPLVRFFIHKLQETTDVLIIDQMNNPGGAVIFSDLTVQSLVGKFDSTKHLRFQVKPTQTFMRSFLELTQAIKENEEIFSEDVKGRVVDTLKSDFAAVKKAYARGDTLSTPVSLLSTSEVLIEVMAKQITANPILAAIFADALGEDVLKPQTYTKPVYMVINQLDFSGGDATPATLQDYGRAKLVGVRTAGAGGTVNEYQNIFGDSFNYRLTTSLMVRKNGSYVENTGVNPDIAFEMTAKDYTTGFENTLERLLMKLDL